MKSTKITTLNPQPSGVNQKLVPAKKYNELVEDTHDINDRLETVEESVTPVIRDLGSGDVLVFTVKNGLATNVQNIGGIGGAARQSYVAASDFINKISYGGSEPITYALRKVGGPALTYYSNPDDAIYNVPASLIGQVVLVEVHVKCGSVDNFCVTYVEAQNNLNL